MSASQTSTRIASTPEAGSDRFRLVHARGEDFAPPAPITSVRVVGGSGKDIVRKFRGNIPAMIGLVLVVVIVLLAVVVPFLPPMGGTPSVASRYLSPSGSHFFGTDELGRDLWSRVWEGTRVSLLIAVIAFGIDVLVGMTYGLVSGYHGGLTDSFLQRIVEMLSGIPQLVIVTLFVLAIGPGVAAIIFGLLLTNWLAMSRVSRAQALRQKGEEYVLASRTLGAGNISIMFREILPNILGPVLTMSMFSIPAAIFTESYLSFVGLGVQPPTASLGSLVSTGYKSFLSYPHLVIIPVVVLALLMVGFTLVADGLKEATDPRLTKVKGH